MRDRIFEAFLDRQQQEAVALDRASDLASITARTDGDGPPRVYMIEFGCTGLVRDRSSGVVSEANRFVVGVTFPHDYLRRISVGEVLTWCGPFDVWHPNIQPPFVCVGRLTPGTALVDLVYQCFEIITYQKVTMREDDALNCPACAWARGQQARFPLDRRPLKRNQPRRSRIAEVAS